MTSYLAAEIERLESEWPLLVKKAEPFPLLSWDDLLEALLEEATTSVEEMVIRGAFAALLKTAPFKPPELLIREVLVLTSSAFDLATRHIPETTPEADMI